VGQQGERAEGVNIKTEDVTEGVKTMVDALMAVADSDKLESIRSEGDQHWLGLQKDQGVRWRGTRKDQGQEWHKGTREQKIDVNTQVDPINDGSQ